MIYEIRPVAEISGFHHLTTNVSAILQMPLRAQHRRGDGSLWLNNQ